MALTYWAQNTALDQIRYDVTQLFPIDVGTDGERIQIDLKWAPSVMFPL